ncbi:flagellar biosynthesis protein FlhF [Paenibacillus aestuarii]|uniref:Flagellar biosynthesis protein FlhF n=1 Tax=Paenibacillus aestuarii TaxID=516965 RepID=A0ABW0K6D4_9BACL|nr:flagellar biosynthesis protein FlhF [Paenibacillus aestuarii]
MRVKRYVVDSMPDALQKIRVDLGKDAIIINTKEIRTGGFLGMFGKKKIEVIAAIDAGSGAASTDSAKSLQAAAAKVQAPVRPVQPVQPQREQAYQSDFPEVPDVLAAVGAAPYKESNRMPPAHGAASLYSPQVYTSTPNASVNPVTPMVTTAPARANVKEDMLMEEMKQMKEMMRKLTLSNAALELPEPLKKLEQLLLDQEVDPNLVQQLIEEVIAEHEELQTEITDDSAQRAIRNKLNVIIHSNHSKRIATSTRVVHFVGPTGVGKTTTIAKLAAEQVLKYQRKVGFITSDTYRISAIEQLKTYATILNVPIEVVFSPQDLTKAFHNLAHCDVIFMDTAGRNFRNEMYVSELNALLKSQGESETILVLSLTTKYRDMKAITHNFNKFKLDKVLFTKMDETDSFGAIINLVHDFSLQLSYVTNGQNVPDDITELNEHEIIDLIMEDRSHE